MFSRALEINENDLMQDRACLLGVPIDVSDIEPVVLTDSISHTGREGHPCHRPVLSPVPPVAQAGGYPIWPVEVARAVPSTRPLRLSRTTEGVALGDAALTLAAVCVGVTRVQAVARVRAVPARCRGWRWTRTGFNHTPHALVRVEELAS